MEKIIQVFNLYVQKEGARPTAIPCSSLRNLYRQVASIAMKSDKLESRFKMAMELLLVNDNIDKIGETFRIAEMGNHLPLGFTLWWEDEPQVLL